MIGHPELTDERQAKIVRRCEERLASMLAEVEGWYPDKVVSTRRLSVEHESYCRRLGSLAKDMGYGKLSYLLNAEGFTIEGEPYSVPRIAPEDAVDSIVASVTGKLESYFDKIDEWYPDRVVIEFPQNHGKSKENLNRQALALGYESWASLLRDYGYEVRYEAAIGRPRTLDHLAVIDELARRYEGREPATDINALREENPDLASKFSSMSAQSRAVFGKTFGQVLRERGIVGGGVRKRGVAVTEREAEDMLTRLAGFVSELDAKPTSLGRLRTAVAGSDESMAGALDSIATWSKEIYGKTPAQLLKSRGILAGGAGTRSTAPTISDGDIEQIIDALKVKYAHAVRPRNVGEFADANPEWRENSIAIKRYLGKRKLGTPAQFLASEELISKIAREDSIARPDEEVLSVFLADVSASAIALQRGAPGSTIIEFDSRVIGDERFGTPPAFEMLRVGDFVELTVSDNSYVHVEFCGWDLGLIGMDERVEYRLVSRVRNAREWGIVGGRVYARVTEISGGQKKPRANLHAFYVENKSAMAVANGLLMSFDGKTVLDCVDTITGMLAIPEGVVAIGPDALEDQPISAVSLPSTLQVIGARAFYRTDMEEVTIPSGVKSIGTRAFTHGISTSSYSDPGTVYRYDDGPVKIDVEEGCERYESRAGSLVELDGADRRLLSLYYRRPSGGSATITVPRGVTALGPSCIEQYESVWDTRLKVSEGVVRMEAGCLDHVRFNRSTLPATLVDIDPQVWFRLCGQGVDPYGNDVEEVLEGPLELYPPMILRIAKGNPRYSVRGVKVYALPAERLTDGSIRVLAGAEELPEDAEPSDGLDEVCFQYEGKEGEGFSYSFKFSQDLENDLAMTVEYLEWL